MFYWLKFYLFAIFFSVLYISAKVVSEADHLQNLRLLVNVQVEVFAIDKHNNINFK